MREDNLDLLYPKINTIWKRDEKNKFNIIVGDYSCPEFENINKWLATEKIDGTNIRVIFEPVPRIIEFKGRTEKADIPKFLQKTLDETFNTQKLLEVFPKGEKIILYGEGYGNKIQSVGKRYCTTTKFILFDVFIDGWWLQRENVEDIASKLGIEIVPSLGIKTTEEIIDLVKNGFESLISEQKHNAEGIVAKSHPPMLFRNKDPIWWKLKKADYNRLEKLLGLKNEVKSVNSSQH